MKFLALPVRTQSPTFSRVNPDMLSSGTATPRVSATGWTVLHHGAMLAVLSLALACSDETSQGGDANADAAFPKLLEKAKAGDASAQMQVGGMYQTGDGVPVNLAESYMWLIVAKNNGMGSAVDPRLQLLETSGQLSAQQIQAAKTKAQKAFPPKSAPPK